MTGLPTPGLELQGSFARVHSPEHRPGAGTDQDKWSVSARWDRRVAGHPLYALVEWAPIGDELKQYDAEIVRGSVRFRWQEVRRDLRRDLDAEAVLASAGTR